MHPLAERNASGGNAEAARPRHAAHRQPQVAHRRLDVERPGRDPSKAPVVFGTKREQITLARPFWARYPWVTCFSNCSLNLLNRSNNSHANYIVGVSCVIRPCACTWTSLRRSLPLRRRQTQTASPRSDLRCADRAIFTPAGRFCWAPAARAAAV